MALEPDTERCANKDAGPQGGGLWDPTLVEEKNEAFFIGMWKPLPNKHVSEHFKLIEHIVGLTFFKI